jgi:four helix bundle protein
MYDLEERTLKFSKRLVKMVQALPKNDINRHQCNQCLRLGTSVGANYREANDAVGKKDFLFRLRISCKEAKETTYWLELISEANPGFAYRVVGLIQESRELTYILSAIISKSESKKDK